MGSVFSIFNRLLGRVKEEFRILMVGLDAAGKTTILVRLKIGEVKTTVPTIGFNVESVEYKNISFNVWDVGGQDIIRPLWKHYYHNSKGIIFVVDCADTARIGIARDELQRILEEPSLKDAVLLVYANKQDLPHAIKPADLAAKLGLTSLSDRPWHMQASCAVTGDGLFEGLDWLAEAIQ